MQHSSRCHNRAKFPRSLRIAQATIDFISAAHDLCHMKRDLQKMAGASHDILIIGGGIQGATIARDAAQRGLKVALVEKKDFSSGTSFASSKMVHGGLRYLANFEFRLIREALKERRIWERIAPHQVDPLPFMVPNYGSHGQKWLMWAGFFLYDLLSFDRKWLKDKDKQLPAHRRISKDEALKLAPGLDPEGLLGAILYYDCQMYAPERLCLECLEEADSLGAEVANHAEAMEILKDGDTVLGARVNDTLSGETFDVHAALTINASGPWADYVLTSAEGGNPSRHLIRSKGIHLITRKVSTDTALLIAVEGSHVLFLPWRNHTIIGTTDTVFAQHPDKVSTREEDIAGLLEKAQKAYPMAGLTRADVKHFYAGLRPLVDTDGNPNNNTAQDTYGASRAAEIVDHEKTSGTKALLSAIGGKWTTSRHIAKQAVDKAVKKLGRPGLTTCRSDELVTWGGATGNFNAFKQTLAEKHPDWSQDIRANLAKTYGSQAPRLIALAEKTPALKERLDPNQPFIAAEVIYAVQEEMALSLEDVVMRRTCVGTLGRPSETLLSAVIDLMRGPLGWSESQIAQERAQLDIHFGPGAH
ncbi:MAG: glycerol-3-phosphate dehydrogenase/oxidase [Alphaproteobacteria bacterium]|nr:MAG: glycerol-3-phosphate dehydrogenase/oxidase [Alphaproteobacteria bacterium]